jgi:LytR cell envelope-related transcriptional attenuator
MPRIKPTTAASLRRLWPLAFAAAALALAVGCSSERLRSAIDNPSLFTTTTSAPPTTLPPSTTTSTTTTTTTTTTTIPPTTTTTSPLVLDNAVVMVANASGVDGAAATLTDKLAARGYVTVKAVNAAGLEEELDISKVYYLADGEAAARSIAAVMGSLVVAPMPTPAWIVGATEALGDANVLIMLGRDLASERIPGISPD